jgi:drug/metabolite transporter (DMT)-like permease
MVRVKHERGKLMKVFVTGGLGAVVIWGTNTILGNAGHQFQTFLALLAFYTAASALFVLSRIRSGKLQLFEIPVYITCMCFLNFGLAPVRNFIDPSQIGRNLSENGEELVQALAYVLLGMMAFLGGVKPRGASESA